MGSALRIASWSWLLAGIALAASCCAPAPATPAPEPLADAADSAPGGRGRDGGAALGDTGSGAAGDQGPRDLGARGDLGASRDLAQDSGRAADGAPGSDLGRRPTDLGAPGDLAPAGADLGGRDQGPSAAESGRPGHGPPYPIVLQHGWTGFESVGPLDYFFRVREHLQEHGFAVYVSEVAPYQSSEVRGAQLAENLRRILAESGAAKVNLVAHSQGGIDARWLISSQGWGDRVASLTTISTPHRGTPVGDAYLGLVPGFTDAVADSLAWLLGQALSGRGDDPDLRASLRQVSEAEMARFNAANPDDPRVAYYSWAGRSFLALASDLCDEGEVPNPERVDLCTPWLQATGRFVGGGLFAPRANDGLIPVDSARWGRFRGCIPADHIDEVGQIAQMGTDPLSGFNHLHFYLGIAGFLQAEGF